MDEQEGYFQTFGPFAPGDYAIGDTVHIIGASGTVLWSFMDEGRLLYLVKCGEGLPMEVEPWEIVQEREEHNG